MIINAMAAIGEDNQLALDNKLPWSYPEDLKLYRKTTKNKMQIMGRSTWESIPERYRDPEHTILVSKTMQDEDLKIADSVEEAIGIAQDLDLDEVWIAGGVGVYAEALRLEVIHQLHISHIPYEGEADRYFPNFTKYIKEVSYKKEIFDEKNNSNFIYKIYDLNEAEIAFSDSPLPSLRGAFARENADWSQASSISVGNGAITAHTIQGALDEMRDSFGSPDTFIVNPTTMSNLTTPTYVGVSSQASNVGDMYHENGETHIVMDDEGSVSRLDSNSWDPQESYSSSQRHSFDVAEYNNYIMTELQKELLNGIMRPENTQVIEATITSKTLEYNSYCYLVDCRVNYSIESAPVYAMGRYEPVAHQRGSPSISADIKVQHGGVQHELTIHLT
jgi:dihydrofolate reductase